jgi:ribonuclease P protein component
MFKKKDSPPVQYGRAELHKDDRLRLKAEFAYVRENGKKFVGKFFILVYIENIGNVEDCLKYGVICSRKFSKKAVVRNRARRLFRESFRLIKKQVKDTHLIFIPRQRIKEQRLQEVQKEMIELLKKAGLWKEPKIK